MTDIVKRLRDPAFSDLVGRYLNEDEAEAVLHAAANEIERLRNALYAISYGASGIEVGASETVSEAITRKARETLGLPPVGLPHQWPPL